MSLPLILAGPILRRVDKDGVSVFLALSQSATVALSVWAGQRTSSGPGTVDQGPGAVATGTAQTIRIGARLHLVVVTAKPAGALAPVGVYSYDVVVNGTTGLLAAGLLTNETGAARLDGVDPQAAPLHLALGYDEGKLPCFVAPPAVLSTLRVAHTSCRRANYPGPDALAWLDDWLSRSKGSRTDDWPQQLFLTGDQIYADDVGAPLLPMLTRLGQELLGVDETFAMTSGFSCKVNGTTLPPLRRGTVVRVQAKMSTQDSANHLLGFGEFAAMYLAAWSSRVWRPLGSDAEMFMPFGNVDGSSRTYVTRWEDCFPDPPDAWTKDKDAVDPDKNTVQAATDFRDAVPKVARVLASIPTYMIWDDHEVTDDWNLSGEWAARVYSTPTGRTIIRNACIAYGLFQGWGNDPAVFADVSSNNARFLSIATHLYGSDLQLPDEVARMEELIGFPEAEASRHARWHYTVDTPCHRTIVLDTRTLRTLGGPLSVAPPSLLGDSLDTQIPDGPLSNGLSLLAVVSAAPVLNPDLFERVIQPLAAAGVDIWTAGGDLFGDTTSPCAALRTSLKHQRGPEQFDMEAWGGDQAAQERLLRKLAGYGRAIILSGDVHFSATLELDYWRFHADTNKTDTSRILQFISSGERNGWPMSAASNIRRSSVLQDLVKGILVERLGWDGAAPVTVPGDKHVGPGRRARMNRSPALLPTAGWPAGTTMDKPADWRWRVRLVSDRRPGGQGDGAPDDPPALAGADIDPLNALPGYTATLARHQKAALDGRMAMRTMVFDSNVSMLSFGGTGPDWTITNRILTGSPGTAPKPKVGTVHETDLKPPAVDAAPTLRFKAG